MISISKVNIMIYSKITKGKAFCYLRYIVILSFNCPSPVVGRLLVVGYPDGPTFERVLS